MHSQRNKSANSSPPSLPLSLLPSASARARECRAAPKSPNQLIVSFHRRRLHSHSTSPLNVRYDVTTDKRLLRRSYRSLVLVHVTNERAALRSTKRISSADFQSYKDRRIWTDENSIAEKKEHEEAAMAIIRAHHILYRVAHRHRDRRPQTSL